MHRLPITLVLTALTGLALATTAIAAPDGAGVDDCPMVDDPAMAAMHETCPMAIGSMPHDGAMPHADHGHQGGAGHGNGSDAHADLFHDRHHR